jgi:diadenosine tetraphosphate (Ap4A) HIT family hydrolase
VSAECVECDVVSGKKTPAGGIVLETPLFLVHALLAPTPLPGWVVLAPKRHARWWWELSPDELAALGPLAARVFEAQRAALDAEHGYAIALGDQLHHMHLHLVPRYKGTPAHLRGRLAFDAKPGDMASDAEAAAAAKKLALACVTEGS